METKNTENPDQASAAAFKYLETMITTIQQHKPQEQKYKTKKEYILYGLKKITENGKDSYYNICNYCNKNILQDILNASEKPIDNTILDFLFCKIIRYTKEKILKTDACTPQERDIMNFYDAHTPLNNNEAYDKLFITHFFDRSTIIDIKKSIAKENIKITENINSYANILSEWNGKILTYKNELKKIYTDYNFVCLSRAFRHLLNAKNSTIKIQRRLLSCGGFLLIAVPCTTFILFHTGFLSSEPVSSHLINLIPLATIELLLIYYFRILLHQFYNTKSQILQIELRRALCAFVEGYTEYKDKNKETIPDKFEALIFSPLVADADKIPSTIDGVEQLLNIVKQCKKIGT